MLLDNFDAHITAQSHECVESAYKSSLYLLPANCTHVCQPLDVGVMVPLKAILRSKWLIESVDELLDEAGNLPCDHAAAPSEVEKQATGYNQESDCSVGRDLRRSYPQKFR